MSLEGDNTKMKKKVLRIIGIVLLIVFLLAAIIIIFLLGIGGIIVSGITSSTLIILYFSSLRTRERNKDFIPHEELEPLIRRTLDRPNANALAKIAANLKTTRALVKNSIKHYYKMSFSKVRRMIAEELKIDATLPSPNHD